MIWGSSDVSGVRREDQFRNDLIRALPTETKIDSGKYQSKVDTGKPQSKSGTSANWSNSAMFRGWDIVDGDEIMG